MPKANNQQLSGWGRFPALQHSVFAPRTQADLHRFIRQNDNPKTIAFGNGRSYGDSALSECIIDCRKAQNYFIDFDTQQGLLTCQAGVILDEILKVIVPKGWFLPVTPGTRFITLGGAIAADVHGKNHHQAGCFSDYVTDLYLLTADGTTVRCNQNLETDLFRATCGGMGLTGIILSATIQLKAIASTEINQTTHKTQNLEETFAVFEHNQSSPYSVAWIDCYAKNKSLGRSLVSLGEFSEDGPIALARKKARTMPRWFPSFMLNAWTIQLFNTLYYHRQRQPVKTERVHYERFFYPLDGIQRWNRMYGHKGFIQYQFILPKDTSFEGLQEILKTIADAGQGSFLAVLKLHGKENNNWLSFPLEGYSLALDFKIQDKLFPLLKKLDQLVLTHRGRFYLAKDARVSREVFEQGYPNIDQFRQFRRTHQMHRHFNSAQSLRVGL